MQTIRDIAQLRQTMRALRHAGATVAFVPTMGALHEGHLTLVKEAKRQADHVVTSIFVNPTQFGPNEDLDAYPRREAEDAALLQAAGVALLWAPHVATMYPQGFATSVKVRALGDALCGAARPGHFDGVTTVVAKLFQQVGPDVALFGEKDWQQLAIIRRMTLDMDFPIQILGVATVREADGLAMSSRNAYLSPRQRKIAGQLPVIMRAAARQSAVTSWPEEVIAAARQAIVNVGFDSVDYLEMRDEATLQTLTSALPGARLFVAARIGGTRLIDNFPVSDTR